MRPFHVLFDRGEPAAVSHPAYANYGALGFPQPPAERPWIFTNFVQSLDGIASLLGRHASGGDISQSPEDRWLMDLLRAHADAVLLGVGTLIEERSLAAEGSRGPVYRVDDPDLLKLREVLGLGRQRNIFVTGNAALKLADYRVFDGDAVEAIIVTTAVGAARLSAKRSHPHLTVLIAGTDVIVDLPAAMRLLRSDFGIRRLLCEGGPTLNGYMTRAGLVDERFLTISPIEVGQQVPGQRSARPNTLAGQGFEKDEAVWWEWISARRVESHQFNRYRRRTP